MTFHRYVALGDSFTEGVGDPDPDRPNGVRGWADRVAEVLAAGTDDFGYANLAIRGRKLRPIIAEQLEPALTLDPDLVTIYAGANDIMRPSVDIDALVADYDAAIGRLSATGARLVLFTAFDPGGFPVFGTMRGRFAVYNELVREVAERHDTTVVDFWRMREYRRPGMWADDRMHMSSAGHQRMAMAALDVLGVAHDLTELDLPPVAQLTKAERRAANLDWAKAHAGPWIRRRISGTSSGDSLDPRYPTLSPVNGTSGRRSRR